MYNYQKQTLKKLLAKKNLPPHLEKLTDEEAKVFINYLTKKESTQRDDRIKQINNLEGSQVFDRWIED